MYKAKVIIANDIVAHPNADRLNVLNYGSASFVIGKDIQVGDMVILFPSDGQLSDDFCKNNNLYRDATKNADKTKSGFFEDSRRVRAQPFRGVKSFGFVCTPEAFNYLGKIELSAGDEFDTLNKQLVCSKYYTPATLRAMNSNMKKKIKSVVYELKEHIDSEKWQYTRPTSFDDTVFVVISEKIHGTSARTGYVKTTRSKQGWFYSLMNNLGLNFDKTDYEHVSGTRRTIINERLDVTTEGQKDYYRWFEHNKISPQLHKGESIYYEIVGYDNAGGTIMDKQNLNKIQDKTKIKPSWENPMTYSYGLEFGERDIFVYRITMTSEDGTETELSWFDVERRCKELGLKTVPVLRTFCTDDANYLDGMVQAFMTDSSSTLDDRHLMEGICIRIESAHGMKIYKSKNWLFGVLEDYLKENADYIDAEEIQ